MTTATYRLQFHKDFRFAHAKELVDYLHELGISDIYASPIFTARPASMHGYDVVDPNQINPELGSPQEFDELIARLRARDMGWLQDIVPNHMAYDGANRMLMDVLENGPNSVFAEFFDIEWDHPVESMRGKVLAPCLGQFYGQCLETGELVLRYDAQGLAVHYYGQRFPINIESYTQVLAPNIRDLRRQLGRRHPDLIKCLGVLYTLKNLPSTEESSERADQIVFVKSMLWELYTTDEAIRNFFDENIAQFNGTPGHPDSFNALDQLLAQQYYRLSFWKVATEEINYRRFFNINELISLRMEDPRVFEATHRLIFELVRAGKITGLRIDHIDGLYDPAGYLRRIREKTGDVYLVVEKILELKERLPETWTVNGTTGYDFTNYANGLFCRRQSEAPMSMLYARFSGSATTFEQLVSEKKRLIIGRYMAGDVDRLATLLKRISSRDRFGGDITLYGLKRALVEVLTFFPVYRTYVSPERYSEEDRARMGEVIRTAKEANPALLYELEFIEKFLLLAHGDHPPEEERSQWIHFIMRLQQLTGPLMAKGFEDTTLYIYNRLISLNEVGGNPGEFGIAPETFHDFNQARARRWPHTLNTTSTHDTKRGEDVRARINVLSEVPEEWEAQVLQWSSLNRPHKTRISGREMPTRNDEYFLYQSMVGALPMEENLRGDFSTRIQEYIIKAVREAKVHTGWLKPDNAYEEAFRSFIEKILDVRESKPFLQAFLAFTRRIARTAVVNSLAQTLLKIAAPGVPDFYQGTELWDLSFVDPDNRRPVDFARRSAWLGEFKRLELEDRGSLLKTLLNRWEDGGVKLYLTYKALNFRRGRRELFHRGDYLPLTVSGELGEHICAFVRSREKSAALVAVPRFTHKWLGREGIFFDVENWRDTLIMLPDKMAPRWHDIFSGADLETVQAEGRPALPAARLFENFPVALLALDEAPR